MPKHSPELTMLLFEALGSKYGHKVTTSSPESLRQKLYRIRKSDSDFTSLAFVISPDDPEGELWIIHKPEATNGPT